MITAPPTFKMGYIDEESTGLALHKLAVWWGTVTEGFTRVKIQGLDRRYEDQGAVGAQRRHI